MQKGKTMAKKDDAPVLAAAIEPVVVQQDPIPTYDFHLIVANPFREFSKGARVSDPNVISSLIASGEINHCHKIKS